MATMTGPTRNASEGTTAARPSPGARQSPGQARAMAVTPPAVDPVRVILQHFWLLVGSVFVGAVVGGIAHFVLLYTYPQYVAEARYTVNLPSPDVFQLAPTVSQMGYQTETMQNTEAINMTSPAVLQVAINTDEVRKTNWASRFFDGPDKFDIDAAYEDLKGRVSARPEPSSTYVRLTVSGSDPSDLLRILNAIVAEYGERLKRQKNMRKAEVTSALTTQQTNLDSQISAINTAIETYIRNNNLPPSILTDPAVMEVQQLTAQINESRQSLVAYQAQADTFAQRLASDDRAFTDDERALAEATRQVQEIKSQLFNLQREEQALRERLGPNHKSVLDTQAQIRAAQVRFEDEMARTLEQNLNVQIETAQNSILALQTQITAIENRLNESRQRLADLNRHVEYLDTQRAEKERLQLAREDTRRRLADAEAYAEQAFTEAATLQQAPAKPTVPEFPKIYLLVPLGVILFGGLTTGIVFLRELTDQRVKGPADISVLPHSRLLGVVPDREEDPANIRPAELLSLEAPQGIVAESIRQMRNPILRAMDQAGHKSLLILGATPGSGASTIAINLAAALASANRRVLLVDANLRRPHVADALGVKASPGLGDVLAGSSSVEQVIVGTRQENLFVLPAGSSANRAFERLTSGSLTDILNRLKMIYDIILIDAPAAVVAAEGQALASDADASLLVVRALQEQRGLVTRLIAQLRELHADHLGVVLNGVRSAAGGYLRENYRQMEDYRRAPGKS